jgi:K+-sensing histidine kinase KdpD
VRSQVEPEGQRQPTPTPAPMPAPAAHATKRPTRASAQVRRPARRPRRAAPVWWARSGPARRISSRVKGWWWRAARWFLDNTFAPSWLPPRWRRPEVGYAAALLTAIAATAITGILAAALPDFPLPGVIALLGVVLIALSWGAGPSLVSTVAMALLLDIFVLAPRFTLSVTSAEDVAATLLFVVVGGVTSVIASQVERQRRVAEATRAEAEAANQQLRAAQRVTDTALAHLGVEDLLAELLERIREVMRVDNVAVLLPTEDGEALTLHTVRGPEEAVAAEVRVPIGEGFAGRVAAARKPLIIEDLAGAEVANRFLKEHLKAVLGVPLLVGERLVGVMHVGSAAARRFTRDDVALLELVAARASLALDRANLFAAAEAARGEATTRAAQLEAIFNAITDGIYVYDAGGQLVQTNRAAHALNPSTEQSAYLERPFAERVERFAVRDAEGHLIATDELPVKRVMRGEELTAEHAADTVMRLPDGRDVLLNTTGAPVRDAGGRLQGAVIVTRDVTERRRLERRTHEALDALLAMAEALVRAPSVEETTDERSGEQIARRLVELTRTMQGCDRVAITAIEPGTGMLRPMAVAGLAPEQERWWEAEMPRHRIAEYLPDALLARLRAGEVVLNPVMPPLRVSEPPLPPSSVLVAPLRVGDQLMGLLTYDYGRATHTYGIAEMALAAAVAKLAALALERERLLREREAARANALALQQANQRMDEFLSIASHELRTPLTAAKANVQIAGRQLDTLLRDLTSEREGDERVTRGIERARTLLDRTDRQLDRQDRLVGDLLDVSRIQTGKLDIQPVPADLGAIVREAVREQRLAQPGRDITLALPPDDAPVIVEADADRIGQVVTNYLTNALKYSPESAPVAVWLERDDKEGARGVARVAVRDEGPGLEPEQQARIWERFHRVPGIEAQSAGVGLGLGLYISKTIIERHGGAVGVESAPGQGSTFWFTLPLAGATAAVED